MPAKVLAISISAGKIRLRFTIVFLRANGGKAAGLEDGLAARAAAILSGL